MNTDNQPASVGDAELRPQADPTPPRAAEPAADAPPEPAADRTADALREQIAVLEQIAALKRERDDYKDRWMRAEAEMANLRQRTRREVDEARQYAVQKFARDVAEAADTLRRGLDSLPKAREGEPELVGKLREGFEGVERSFLAILERNGVTRNDPAFQPFDANHHQAMAEQPSAEHPPGTIIQVWTPVWMLNGRLLRPAMVVVAAKAAGPDA